MNHQDTKAGSGAALNYYKSAFRDQRPDYVPDTVEILQCVYSDTPDPDYIVLPGEHKAESNKWGAICVKARNGKMLGIKPREFEPLTWRINDKQ
jgi:hypothetical protein